MWTREKLESTGWEYCDERTHEVAGIYDEDGSGALLFESRASAAGHGRLAGSAPELALACLEARKLADAIVCSYPKADAISGISADLLRAIDAALALAGVKP